MKKHRKPASNRREAQIGVRFTDEEKKRIEERSVALEFESASAWIRRIVLNALPNA